MSDEKIEKTKKVVEENKEKISTDKISGKEAFKDVMEWVYCIIIALVLALLFRYFIATPTIVKQRSMYPTLVEDQRLILNRTFRIVGYKPKVGQIITFEAPSIEYGDEVDQSNPVAIYLNEPKGLASKFVYYCMEITKVSYIKRVIAVEGDHVKIENGRVYVNGILQEEKYLKDDVNTESSRYNDFIVPKDHVFAMGDNRTKSTDCREFGCVPYNKIEGIVAFRFWPLSQIGTIK